jgi:RNA polymerase sigma factor (sigma-70 family)
MPTPQTADAALLDASRAGEVGAFRQLVERYQNLVCAVAFAHTGDRTLAEDIGQEAFLVAFTRLDTVREPDRLSAWLTGITRNLAGKALRARRREKISDAATLDATPDSTPGPLDEVLSRESERAVWHALEALPESYREPLVLYYREGQSVREVAAGLGLTEDAAKQRLSRGRRALKDGVTQLVEKTLETSRPTAAFTAAVLAVVASASSAAAAGPAGVEAGSGASGASGAGSKIAWTAAAAAATLALAVGAFSKVVAREPLFESAIASDQSANRSILERLERERQRLGSAATLPCRLAGRVTEPGGAPVAGATIALWSATTEPFEPIIETSGGDGTWRAEGLEAGEYQISIAAPGRRAMTARRTCAANRAADSADIETTADHRGVKLAGRVSDVGGGPIAGASLWLVAGSGANAIPIITTTGDDGSYGFDVAPDRYTLMVHHPGYILDARPLAVSSDRTESFTLLPGAEIEGVVIDARSGEPIAGAKVSGRSVNEPGDIRWLMASTMADAMPATTDAAGRFRLSGLPPGAVEVTARRGELTSAVPARVELAIASTRPELEVPVVPGATVAGFVVYRGDPDRGVPGVSVVLQSPSTPVPQSAATTDRSGYFEIVGVPDDEYRLVVVGGPAVAAVRAEPVEVAGGDIEPILVEVDGGVAIRGRLASPARAELRLERPGAPAGIWAGASLSLSLATIDTSGRFEFPAVMPGIYDVVARTVDGAGRTRVTAGDNGADGVVIDIAPIGSIRGIAIDGDGRPAVGLVIEARTDDRSLWETLLHANARTDGEGRFEILGLGAGDYQLRVFGPRGQRPLADSGMEPPSVAVESDAVSLTLTVAGDAKEIRGRVVDDAGAPVEDARVEINTRPGRSAPFGYQALPVLTDASGRFTIGDVYGDGHQIHASGPTGMRRSPARVIDGDGEAISLTLRPVGSAVIRVNRGGEPVTDFDIRIDDGPSEVRSWALERRGGVVEVPAVIAGDYDLELRSARGYASRTVSIRRSGVTEIAVELTPTAAVRGVVVGSGGAPIAGAVVAASGGVVLDMEKADRLAGDARPITDADGSFEITGLIAGQGALLVMRSSTDPTPIAWVDVSLSPGETLELGSVTAGAIRRLEDLPYRDRSSDLGLRFFAGPNPPTPARLAALDAAAEPRELIDGEGGRLWIAELTPGGVAASAGLRAGDRVLAVGRSIVGEDIRPVDAVVSLSQPWRSRGRAVNWIIERRGRELTIPIHVR